MAAQRRGHGAAISAPAIALRSERGPSAVVIRRLQPGDGAIAGAIFFDAVHRGTAGYYTAEQRNAWAGTAPDPAAWCDRLHGVDGFVAELDGTPVGFMTIDPQGHIDLAYVGADALGRGIGHALYCAVEDHAERCGTVRLTTEASRMAKPFFARQSWVVERAQVIHRHGVALENFRMVKQLDGRV